MSLVERSMTSSVVIRTLRRIAAGSAVMSTASSVTRWPDVRQWLRQTRRRIVVGAGGDWSNQREIRTIELLDALLSSSRIASALSSVVSPSIVALRDAGVTRVWDRVLGLDNPMKVRTVGCAMISAVLCHTALLALMGVRVFALGWSIRVVLLAAGVAALWRPEPLAAAWRDKLTS